jgi:alpha-1,2-mannosyltransferase
LIFFPYYVLTRQWRQLGMATATFAAATGVGFFLFPRDSLYFWTHTDSSGRLGVDRMDNVSILGTLSRWMADPGQARMVWYGLALVVGLAAFWRAWRHFSRGEQMEAALVIGAASTAISPIAWPNYQLWLPMAAVWLIATGERRTRLIGVLIFVPYFALYAYPLYGLIDPAGHPLELVARILWELNVVVPTLICVLGLPHRVGSVMGSESVADSAPGQSPVPAVVPGSLR